MRTPFAGDPEFRRLLSPDDGPPPDLVRVALEVARDAYPGLDSTTYLGRVEDLAARVRERCTSPDRPRNILGQINWVMFVEEEFRGNRAEYYDPRNSYLNEVMDRRRGIPISLAVLYWGIAERVGLRMEGVNIPGHFVLRTGSGEQTIFVDAFHSGALLDRQGCQRLVTRQMGQDVPLTDEQFSGCRRDEVVARMLRNLKSIYLQQDELTSALPVVRRIAALCPEVVTEQRELAMLCLRLDRPAEAIEPLESYLSARPDAPDRHDLQALLRVIRREVARWN